MRFLMLACAALLAGCLHAQAPVHPVRHTTPAQFEKLINDAKTIVDAAEVVETEGWTREEWEGPAIEAYESYLSAQVYDSAAEVAYRFELGPTRISYAIRRARRAAFDEFRLGSEEKWQSAPMMSGSRQNTHALSGERFLRQEIAAACGYGPTQWIRRRAVEDAFASYEFQGASRMVIYDLFERTCPLNVEERKDIVEATMQIGDYPRALRYAEKAFLTVPERIEFVDYFFLNQGCSFGFEAAARLKLSDDDVVALLERADCERYPALEVKRWAFASPEQAAAFFFAAAKGEEYGLALALAPFTGFTLQQARVYLVMEAFGGRDEQKLLELFPYDLDLKDATFSWAIANGRARFVGNVTEDVIWEERAFAKLIEEGKFEDAAEIADYGPSLSFRKQGIGLAFVASIKAKKLDVIRYFLYRYDQLLTEEMYRTEWKRIHGEKAPDLHPKKKMKKRRRKPCPESDDWEIKRCD